MTVYNERLIAPQELVRYMPRTLPGETSIQRKTTRGVAIVTGGSQGIGAACVRRFVQSGWSVATISLPGESFEPMPKGSVLTLSGDLVHEHVRQTLVEQTLKCYGRID